MTRLESDITEAKRLLDQGLIGGARSRLEAVIRAEPTSHAGRFLLGVALSKLGEFNSAAEHLRKAVEIGGEDARALTLLGEALRQTGRHEAAVEALSRAAALTDDPEPRLGLAQTHLAARRYCAAAEACGALVEAKPDFPGARSCLGAALVALGRADEAIDHLRKAAELEPWSPWAASALASALNYTGAGPADLRAAHEAYAKTLGPGPGKPGGARQPMHSLGTRLTTDGALRVGLIVPDFRSHVVACFLSPLVEHLDRSRLELYCYAATSANDETTAPFRKASRIFRPVAGHGDFALAHLIATDRVQVLIDIAGHAPPGSRLPVLDLRPAPVQALYLGYPATSGLGAVNWRIVDSQSDPPESDAFSVERAWRIDPCRMIYRAPGPPPWPEPAPAGTVRFGSFSTPAKITAETIAAWSRVLHAVRGSTLLLKHQNLSDQASRADLAARFAARKLGPERVLIEGPVAGGGPLSPQYARVDVALDTLPFGGLTTVCEALACGVPVVMRTGPAPASRLGLSALHAVGLADLAVTTTKAYTDAAAALAHDPARLADLRRSLPTRLASSPLGDFAGFASRFSDAVRGMWADYVRGSR